MKSFQQFSHQQIIGLSAGLFFVFLAGDFVTGTQTDFSTLIKLLALGGVVYGMILPAYHDWKDLKTKIAQINSEPISIVQYTAVPDVPVQVEPIVIKSAPTKTPPANLPTAELVIKAPVQAVVAAPPAPAQAPVPPRVATVAVEAPQAQAPAPAPAPTPAKPQIQVVVKKTEQVKTEVKTEVKVEEPRAVEQKIEQKIEEKKEEKKVERPEPLTLLRTELYALDRKEHKDKPMSYFVNNQTLEGEVTLGTNISDIVKLAEAHGRMMPLAKLGDLFKSPVVDEKTLGLWLLINKFKATSSLPEKKSYYIFYNSYRGGLQNWNLIDLGARNIIGEYIVLDAAERAQVMNMAGNASVWDKRSVLMSAHPLLARSEFEYVESAVMALAGDNEELIQTAVGLVLKEYHKQDQAKAVNFLRQNFSRLSKQAVRIGTERMTKEERKPYLRGELPLTVSKIESTV